MDVIEEYQHPAWVTVVGTAVSYGLILGFMFFVLFVVPFLVVWQVL